MAILIVSEYLCLDIRVIIEVSFDIHPIQYLIVANDLKKVGSINFQPFQVSVFVNSDRLEVYLHFIVFCSISISSTMVLLKHLR